MRVYNRKEFLALAAGTIYAVGVQWSFEGFCIKGETVGNDWWYLDPAWVDGRDDMECLDRLDEMLETGASYPMQDSEARNGIYDPEEIFLVLERLDVMVLREKLDLALSISKESST